MWDQLAETLQGLSNVIQTHPHHDGSQDGLCWWRKVAYPLEIKHGVLEHSI